MCSCIFVVTEWPRGGLCQLGFMTSQLQTHPCLPCFVMMELDSADYIYPLPAGLVLGSAEKTIEGLEGRRVGRDAYPSVLCFPWDIKKVGVKWTLAHIPQLNVLCRFLRTPPSMFLHRFADQGQPPPAGVLITTMTRYFHGSTVS